MDAECIRNHERRHFTSGYVLSGVFTLADFQICEVLPFVHGNNPAVLDPSAAVNMTQTQNGSDAPSSDDFSILI